MGLAISKEQTKAVVGGIVLVALSLYTVRKIRGRQCSSVIDQIEKDVNAQEKPPLRGFTAEQLAEFDGTNGKPVYIGVLGRIFNGDPRFYGPGSPYSTFAGKEATLPLARGDMAAPVNVSNAKVLLSPSELKTAEQWMDKFAAKYDEVGWFETADSAKL